jgi:hypothetical protein
LNGLVIDEDIHVGHENRSGLSVDGGLGTWNFLEGACKVDLQVVEIEEIGLVSQAGKICNQHFDCVKGDDHVHDVEALIILGGRTDIQVDFKRI